MNAHRTILSPTAQVLIALGLVVRPHSICAQGGSIQISDDGLQKILLEHLDSTDARVRFDAAMQLEGQRVQSMSNLLVILNSPIPDDRKMETAATFADLVSTNARVRFDAAMQIEGQQDQMLANLAALLKSPISDDRKMDAAAILGENKSSYAISYLVNHLEWQTNLISNPAAHSNFYGDLFSSWISLTNPSGHQSDLSTLIRTVPVTRSLARIGVDAIPALLDRISQSDDEGIIEICDNTCIEIEGGGNVAAEVTQLRLQDRLQKETDPKKKERFQIALNMLKQLKLLEN